MTPNTASENQCALMRVRCQTMPTAIRLPAIHQASRLDGGRIAATATSRMPALTACPEGNEPWSTENSGPNSVFAMSSAGRGRSTRFFVSCETTMLPASSAVRKNSADRQRRITTATRGSAGS